MRWCQSWLRRVEFVVCPAHIQSPSSIEPVDPDGERGAIPCIILGDWGDDMTVTSMFD